MATVQRPGTTPRNSKPFLLKTKGQHRLNQVKKRETKLTRTKERTQEYTRRQAHAETNNDINANRQRKARHTDTNACRRKEEDKHARRNECRHSQRDIQRARLTNVESI